MRKIARWFFALCLSLIMAGLIAEIYFRQYLPQSTYDRLNLPYDFHCFTRSDYYYIAMKKNSNCLLKSNFNDFPPTVIITNSLGLRNREIGSKTREEKRILFVGDSYTLGWGVEEDQAFPRIIENDFKNERGGKVESINAGLAGSGPGYYYLFLKNSGLNLEPDVVVVGFFMANDIPFGRFSDWLEVNGSGLPEKIRVSEFSNLSGNLYFVNRPGKYRFPILRNLHVFSYLLDRVIPDRTGVINKQIEAMICLYKYSCPDLETTKENVKKLFLGIKDMAEGKGAKLLVVFIPMELELTQNPSVNYWGVPLLPKDLDYPYDQFEKFFKGNGIDYLDLRKDFRENEANGLYLRDGHFSPVGHRLAAEVIGKKLREYLYE